MVICDKCAVRGKPDILGSDPRCAFPNGGQFDPHNWNCATANAIREICGESRDDERSKWVDFQHCCDQKYATINLVRMDDYTVGDALALFVTWYKSRGATNDMWLMFEEEPPRRPTEAECDAIINAFPSKTEWMTAPDAGPFTGLS